MQNHQILISLRRFTITFPALFMVMDLLVFPSFPELMWTLKFEYYDRCGVGGRECSSELQLTIFQDTKGNDRKSNG